MSSKLDTKLDFDRGLLLDVGIFDKENNGFLSVNLNDIITPVTIGGKRLVLTTRELLRAGEWEDRIAFHPLSEQISQGPSPVLNAFKTYIMERVKEYFKAVIDSLGELAADPKRQKNLSAKAMKYLQSFGGLEFDATTLKTLRAVLKATNNVPEKRFLNIFLQNGGPNGALRTCQIAFPFMEDDDASDPLTYFGVKMPRKTKDKALIVALLEYVLGSAEERNTLYTKSAKDGDAPYLHSLLMSFEALATRINDLIDIHGTACQNLKPLKFDLTWLEHMAEFDKFVRTYGVSVPALPGNVGVDDKDIELPEDSSTNAYATSADDVGIDTGKEKPDLPWEDDERERPSRPSRERERDRDERPSDERRSGRSLADLMRGKNKGRDRDGDRDDRSRRERDREDRGSRRDRDDREDRGSRSRRNDW